MGNKNDKKINIVKQLRLFDKEDKNKNDVSISKNKIDDINDYDNIIDDDFKVDDDDYNTNEIYAGSRSYTENLLNDKEVQKIISNVGSSLLISNDEKAFEYFCNNISENKIVISFIKAMQDYMKEETRKALSEDKNVTPLSKIYIHDINFDNYEINTVLDEIINEKRFNQTEIADRMGINRTTLYNLSKSPGSVSLVNAFKISKLLGVSIEDLFFYREKE